MPYLISQITNNNISITGVLLSVIRALPFRSSLIIKTAAEAAPDKRHKELRNRYLPSPISRTRWNGKDRYSPAISIRRFMTANSPSL